METQAGSAGEQSPTGEPLAAWLEARGRLGVEDAVWMVLVAAAAAAEAWPKRTRAAWCCATSRPVTCG